MKQTYSVELPIEDGQGNELPGKWYLTFADQMLESIFGEYLELDAVGDQRHLADRLAKLNHIIEPYGYKVVTTGIPATIPVKRSLSSASCCPQTVPMGSAGDKAPNHP